MNARRQPKRYQRTDRVGELVREIVATAMDRIDDDRLFPIAVTDVEVDNELNRAVVFYDVLDEDDVEDAEAALEDHRHRLQQQLGAQSRLRRTPTLEFRVDPSIGAANRIETILEGLGMGEDSDAETDDEAHGGAT